MPYVSTEVTPTLFHPQENQELLREIIMGAFIARQPNGLLCRWSSVVDNITHYNMTEDEYVEYCAEEARERARREIKDYIQPFSEILEMRDSDLVLQCLGAIANPDDYTEDEIAERKAEMVRLQSEFDALVETMSKED